MHLLSTVTTLKQSSTGSKNVGKPYMMQCSVYTSEKINNTMIKINWIGPDGFIRNTSRIVIHPTVSDDDIIHNSTLQFLYLRQNDIGPFTCNVTILNITLSQTFQLDNITSKSLIMSNFNCVCYLSLVIITGTVY